MAGFFAFFVLVVVAAAFAAAVLRLGAQLSIRAVKQAGIQILVFGGAILVAMVGVYGSVASNGVAGKVEFLIVSVIASCTFIVLVSMGLSAVVLLFHVLVHASDLHPSLGRELLEPLTRTLSATRQDLNHALSPSAVPMGSEASLEQSHAGSLAASVKGFGETEQILEERLAARRRFIDDYHRAPASTIVLSISALLLVFALFVGCRSMVPQSSDPQAYLAWLARIAEPGRATQSSDGGALVANTGSSQQFIQVTIDPGRARDDRTATCFEPSRRPRSPRHRSPTPHSRPPTSTPHHGMSCPG
ncbi:MAG TPA: hypothetical protein VG841_13285 [Caulobacterales bacterium]|nr:hypothetical protein [Caulobacterales bacterium]